MKLGLPKDNKDAVYSSRIGYLDYKKRNKIDKTNKQIVNEINKISEYQI
jgi:hypothetical protein